MSLTEGRDEIKRVFERFVEILENNTTDALDEVLDENVELFSTNRGNARGLENVKRALEWQGTAVNYRRCRIFNFVAFTESGIGRQSAVVTTLVGIDDPDYFHYFQYGGYYLNDYALCGGEWKITRIRFNLDMEDGNTCFVRGWWKLIDYRYLEGAASYPIVSELDAPWTAVKHKESLGDERERVLDALYRYAWGIDHADMHIFMTCIDDGVSFGMTASGAPASDGELTSKGEMIRFMKYKRYKEAVMEHIYKIVSVVIDGDEAVVEAYRYEPHRMGTQKLNKYNKEWDFYTGKFEFVFARRDGEWKLKLNNVKELRVFSEQTHRDGRFY